MVYMTLGLDDRQQFQLTKYPDISTDVDRETSGSPTPPPQRATIRQAIEGMPVEELKKLLIKIWRELEDSRLVIDNAVRRPIPGFKKRKRKAFEFCRKCHTHFDVELNDMGSCRYHDGQYSTLFQRPGAFGSWLTLLKKHDR
jgi:hypothetical protein